MTDTVHPLRLAVGSHEAGSGKGCAMNVISWENGDRRITDLPPCSDWLLARIVQNVNDRICDHRDGDLLCPTCSVEVLALAHRTVGTGRSVNIDRRRRVWVKIVVDRARPILRRVDDPVARDVVERALDAAEAVADDRSAANWAAAESARTAAAARTPSTLTDGHYVVEDFVADAAYIAAVGATGAATAASATAAYRAASNAYHSASAIDGRLRAAAHRAIDLFIELTGHTEHVPDPAVTGRAVASMTGQP